MMRFTDKPILGMIHLSGTGKAEIIDRALEEIQMYKQEGLHGCIVENYHSDIFHVIAVLKELRSVRLSNFDIGINILPNEFEKAYMLSDCFDLNFIQLDYIAGLYEGESSKKFDWKYFQLYRRCYPNVQMLGGVWPKYYIPVRDSVLANDIADAKLRADAIVVTGKGTGITTAMLKIQDFRTLSGNFPIIVGAGVNKDNVVEQLSVADGAIVGSAFKPNNMTSEKAERYLIQQFMNEYKKIK